MKYAKWTFIGLLAVIVIGFLHYTLPQHDIVRIVGTENRRIDFGENSIFWASPAGGAAQMGNRDVFFIQTQRANGKPMVYRNEDTGWGWPPYFKLDSSNLQTMAQDLVSNKADPLWVSMTHYGWRNEWLSIYPNAVSVKVVSGPDARIIPWFNIIFLILLLVGVLFVRRLWLRFRHRSIDPMFNDGPSDNGAHGRGKSFWGRMRGKNRK